MSGVCRQIVVSHLSLIIFIWGNEYFDLIALFGGNPTPVNILECLLESFLVLLLAVGNYIWFFRMEKKIRYLESFQVICANCKKIKSNDDWIELDKWLQKEKSVDLSHGFCEECFAKLYPEFSQLRKKSCKKIL